MVRWRFWQSQKSLPKANAVQRENLREARKYYNAKQYDLAEPFLQKMLQSEPDNEWALDVYSRLLMNTHRHIEAIPLLDDLCIPGPDLPDYQIRLSRCLFNVNRINRCIETLRQMIYNQTISEVGWELLQRAIAKELDKQEADKFWIELSESGIDSPQVDLEIIRIQLQLSQLEAAAGRIQKVTSSLDDLQLTDAWKMKLVNILLDQDSPEIADKILSTLPQNVPEYTKTLIKTKRALGDNDGAIQIAREALDGNSNHGVMFAAMRLAWDIGSMEEVVIFSQNIIDDKPAQKVANRFRLRALVKIGDVERIQLAIGDTLNSLPDFIEAHRVMIDIAFHEFEDWALVNHHCRAILTFQPYDRRALCHLIHAELRLGNFSQVGELIARATELHPDDDEVDLTAAQALWKMDTGKHIDRINRMLNRHDLAPIYSVAPDQNISVENIRCDAPKSSQEPQPLVTVIMTVYGRDEYLDVAIDSILAQTHQNIELIAVDDCSQDDSFEYLLKRASEEPRLKAIQVDKNGGTYCAKNAAIAIASGKYIAFMDSDDWTHPQRIERQLQSIHGEDYRASCHSYFRINEFGDIFYKGVGAIRLACISLLAKRSVFEKVGFFDSMRVGADTEFIERIKATFGDDSVLHEKIPSMFMLNHSSSLTGGGRFQISWRSITGPRLEHHSSFKSWHKKIRFGGEPPFVEYPLRVRPYIIPEEMTAGETHWHPAMQLFSQQIMARSERWTSGRTTAPWQGQLAEHSAGLLWAKQQGLKTQKVVWGGGDVSTIPELDQLPRRLLIRDINSSDSSQIFVENGIDIFDDSEWTKSRIEKFVKRSNSSNSYPEKWVIEELPRPDPFDENEKIPVEWRFYCFGDEIALIHSISYRTDEAKSGEIHHYFSSDLRQFQRKISKSNPVPSDPLFFPNCFVEMVNKVQQIGKKLNSFMRIDMRAGEKGPVFSKFTPLPEDVSDLSIWADQYLATFWRGMEGVED